MTASINRAPGMSREPRPGDILLDKTIGTGVDVLEVTGQGVTIGQPHYGNGPYLLAWNDLQDWELEADAYMRGNLLYLREKYAIGFITHDELCQGLDSVLAGGPINVPQKT